MSPAKRVDFAEIKEAVSITDILEHYGALAALKRGEDWFRGPCPLCGSQTRTGFAVKISKNWYKCFACDANGTSVLDFVAQKEGVTIRKAALLITEWFELPPGAAKPPEPIPPPDRGTTNWATPAPEPEQESPEPEPKPVRRNPPLTFELKHLESDPEELPWLKDWLAEQAISHWSLDYFGAGYCNKGLQKGRLAIPIHNQDGTLLAYAGRSVERGPGVELYRYPNPYNRRLDLYNYHRAIASQDFQQLGLFLVSDFLEVWRFFEAGFENVVATMHESVSPEQIGLLREALQPTGKLAVVLPAPGLEAKIPELTRHFFVWAVEGSPLNVRETLMQLFSIKRLEARVLP